jgi:hypothetical protein
MKKLLALLIAGAFATSAFAVEDSTSSNEMMIDSAKPNASSSKHHKKHSKKHKKQNASANATM